MKWELELGPLEPLKTIEGTKQRLSNLGYYKGKIDDVEGESLKDSVMRFQRDQGLTEDGVITAETREAINAKHAL